jgi:putative phosphoribosyl transferase
MRQSLGGTRGFRDRREGGRALAARLGAYAGRRDVVVLALPRGGVPVAHEVASALGAPLDVFVVRKIGVPDQPELAMGAVASGGALVLNRSVLRDARVSADVVRARVRRELAALARQERAYREGRPPVEVRGRTALLVDDGLATGASAKVAVAALRERRAARPVVAAPVGPPDTCAALRADGAEVVCALTPEPFLAVGHWYEDFSQTTDEEVRDLLARAARPQRSRAP